MGQTFTARLRRRLGGTSPEMAKLTAPVLDQS